MECYSVCSVDIDTKYQKKMVLDVLSGASLLQNVVRLIDIWFYKNTSKKSKISRKIKKCGVTHMINTQRQILQFNLKIREAKYPNH